MKIKLLSLSFFMVDFLFASQQPSDLERSSVVSGQHEVQFVWMWDQANVESLPNNEQLGCKSSVFTNGLGGCVAMAYIIKTMSGVQHAFMSHYPPLSRLDQIHGFQAAHRRLNQLSSGDPIVQKRLIILAPEEWKKDADGKYTILSVDQGDERLIKELGAVAGIDPIVEPYPMGRMDCAGVKPWELLPEDQVVMADFSVSLTSDGKAEWRSFTALHDVWEKRCTSLIPRPNQHIVYHLNPLKNGVMSREYNLYTRIRK